MPSPVGHALGGVIAGWVVGGRPGPCFLERFDVRHTPAPRPSSRHGQWLPLAILGALPDLDLIFGTHSASTHSFGAVTIVAFIAGLLAWARPYGPDGQRCLWLTMCTAAAAYASHLALDALGTDTAAPIGIMMAWPFSEEFVKAPLSIFPPVMRDVRTLKFWLAIPVSLGVELAVLLPLLVAVARWRRRDPHASR